MTIPKWNDERTQALVNAVGDESPVTQDTVAEVAEALETSKRSISSKLRKMGYDVELVSAGTAKTFTDEQADALAEFVTDNCGDLTYGQIAEQFEGGVFSPKQIQGKILSMELTEHVKPTPKPEAVRTYTEAEEATFLQMVSEGAFLEEIAEALGKALPSVRGKALSFLRAEQIDAIPKQRDVKGSEKVDAFAELDDVAEMTVEAIAEAIGKTPRGVRTMLTRRGINCADYKGADKKAKADAS